MEQPDKLLQAFGIGPADLEANRAGKLGDAQRRNMLRSGVSNIFGAFVVGVLLAAILFFVANKPLKPVQFGVAGFLFLAVLAVGINYYQKTRAAVADGIVVVLSGPVEVRSRGKNGFWLSVADRSFRMPVRPWNVQGGAAYRVYIAPRLSLIVAMEPEAPAARTT